MTRARALLAATTAAVILASAATGHADARPQNLKQARTNLSAVVKAEVKAKRWPKPSRRVGLAVGYVVAYTAAPRGGVRLNCRSGSTSQVWWCTLRDGREADVRVTRTGRATVRIVTGLIGG